jgi:hypothetical protein
MATMMADLPKDRTSALLALWVRCYPNALASSQPTAASIAKVGNSLRSSVSGHSRFDSSRILSPILVDVKIEIAEHHAQRKKTIYFASELTRQDALPSQRLTKSIHRRESPQRAFSAQVSVNA